MKPKRTIPGGRIQWKGTDVCMDFDCVCGLFFHVDGEFVYSVECPHCHKMYTLDSFVGATEIDTRPEACHVVGRR